MVERELAIDHAVHAKPPLLGEDGRDEQRGVDAIEAIVRRLERAQAGDVEVGAGNRGRRARRRGDPHVGARGVGAEPSREQVAGPARHRSDGDPRRSGKKEATAIEPARDVLVRFGRRGPGRPGRRPQQQRQRAGRRERPDDRRENVRGRALGSRQRRPDPDRPERRDAGEPDPRAP